MIGLGKLGLPVATALAVKGIEVYGYDPCVGDFPRDLSHEAGLEEFVRVGRERMHFCDTVEEVVRATDGVVFCAIQTPHKPRFEGVTPLPEDRADFDYSYLCRGVKDLADAAREQHKRITLAVISTVLPGTMKRSVQPLLGQFVSLAYNPSFIAMGTTLKDFLRPEFVLLGGDTAPVKRVYLQADIGPVVQTSIPNAELIKVAYNTFIGLKLAFANTIMEVCHKTDCDVDEVMGALKRANRRLISSAYLDGGMGDGGGCHPRDNIALSWLARKLDLSHDLFEDAMVAREAQTQWLVDLVTEHSRRTQLPAAILGLAYKPGSRITTGSPARLAFAQLMKNGHHLYGGVRIYDPHVSEPLVDTSVPSEPAVFLVGCKHPEFAKWKLPEGSVVIDPWRYIPDRAGVEIVRVGAAQERETAGVGWPD